MGGRGCDSGQQLFCADEKICQINRLYGGGVGPETEKDGIAVCLGIGLAKRNILGLHLCLR